MMLSILQYGFRRCLIFGVGHGFYLIAAGDIGWLDCAKNHPCKDVGFTTVVRHIYYCPLLHTKIQPDEEHGSVVEEMLRYVSERG